MINQFGNKKEKKKKDNFSNQSRKLNQSNTRSEHLKHKTISNYATKFRSISLKAQILDFRTYL